MTEARDYLIISMAATLAAMGDVAGSERRGSCSWPGRSAILGVVGAALGLRRDDLERQATLRDLSTCVAVFQEDGLPLRDFHTVQTVPTAAAKRPSSRASALRAAGDRVNPVITRRDYRMGVHFGVALWDHAGRPLEEIAEALRRPVFTLFFGRKSCPFAAPLAPRIVRARTPIEALSETPPPPWRDERRPVCMYATDRFDDRVADIEIRQDEPLDRSRWHFGAREILILSRETE